MLKRFIFAGMILVLTVSGTGEAVSGSGHVPEPKTEQTDLQDEISVDDTGVCGEEEYLLEYRGNKHIRVRDGFGRYIAEFTKYIYTPLELIRRDALISFYNTGANHVLNLSSGKVVASFPADSREVNVAGKMIQELDPENGQFWLYDSDGSLLYTSAALPGSMGEHVEGRLLALKSGYIAASKCNDTCFAVLVGPKGEERSILPERFARALFEWGTQTFGDSVILIDTDEEDNRHYDLYSPEGVPELTNLKGYVEEYKDLVDEIWDYSSKDIRYILREEDGMTVVYGEMLEPEGVIDPEEASGVMITCYDGFFPGMAYAQLEGRRCEGFLICRGEVWMLYDCTRYVPYAREGGDYIVYLDGKTVRIALAENEESLELISEDFYVARRQDGKQVIRRMDTGSLFPDEESAYPDSALISLPRGGVMISWKTEKHHEVYDWTESYELYGLSGKKTVFGPEQCYLRLSQTGYLQMRRGIYEGYADIRGDWLCRWIYNVFQE